MLKLPLIAGFISAAILVPASSLAQDYANKPIRVVTAVAGGGNDLVARLLAQGLTVSLGQQVIVDSRGIVAPEIVAKSPPDGYTLLVYTSNVWLLPLMQDSAAWDPIKDFAPITLIASAPSVLVVHPSLPVKSVIELIALAKAKPGVLNYGSASIGGPPHLGAELFKAMAGVNIVRINYKGSGPSINALIAGEVQLSFPNAGPVMPHVRAGRLRALAVGSPQASALAPGVPSVAESGLPGYQSVSPSGAFGPAKLPAALVNRLNREIVTVLNKPEVRERFFNAGSEVVGSSPEEFGAMVKADMVRMGKVIKEAGIRAE